NLLIGGFIRAPDGSITKFRLKGAKAGTLSVAINSRDVIAGTYIDNGCHVDSFLRHANGKATTFHYPGTSCCAWVQAMDQHGTVVGNYYDAQDRDYGFRRTADGTFTLIQPDGSSSSEASGINGNGQITGFYT